jgi:hypothetical protein
MSHQPFIHTWTSTQDMVKSLAVQDIPQDWPNEGLSSVNELEMTLSSFDYAYLFLNEHGLSIT